MSGYCQPDHSVPAPVTTPAASISGSTPIVWAVPKLIASASTCGSIRAYSARCRCGS
ncbi:Uncharacterised protein [Mycobacteroides abscessus subsp. abscessus]|nr:Uncharacterised protein [Mycobacteroides abscessus subsp. abscessus]